MLLALGQKKIGRTRPALAEMKIRAGDHMADTQATGQHLPREGFLQPNHRGLLLFMKRDPARKSPPQFKLTVKELRIPHRNCTACGLNLKDWGG